MSYIPSGLLSLYKEVADEFITSELTGSLCTLYYEGKKEICECGVGFGDSNSQSVFTSGGPANANSHCVYCDDTGYRISEVTEEINLRLSFDRNQWKNFSGVQVPDGGKMIDLVTIGKATDIPKVKKCSYIRCPTKFKNYSHLSFSLAYEPLPHGFDRGSYFLAFWSRV